MRIRRPSRYPGFIGIGPALGLSVILDRVAIEFLCHSSLERFICDLSEDIGRELIALTD
jgi:hypothetical protein